MVNTTNSDWNYSAGLEPMTIFTLAAGTILEPEIPMNKLLPPIPTDGTLGVARF